MKAILKVPEKEISFDLKNVTIDQYTAVKETVGDFNMTHIEPDGEPFVLITSNMPLELKDEISTLIKRYCNH